MRHSRLAFVVATILSPFVTTIASAQVDATFATFGTGCPGTGTGLAPGHTVVPANMANSFGSPNAIPFGWVPVRFQQVILGADLPNAFTIAGVSLRQSNRGPISNRFTLDFEMQVGLTTRAPATMSTTFATNFDSGSPVVVLPRVQLVFPDMVPTGPTSPADFFFTIPWTNTFAWDPAAGRNLLVQVTVYGNSYGGVASGYGLDVGGGASTARLYGSPATATTGTLEQGLGVVMGLRALTHTAVPALYSTNTPLIGDTFRVRVNQAHASTPATMLLGFSNTAFGAFPLPLDLGWIGAPGCGLLTSIEDAASFSINAAGAGSYTYSIPNDIYLLGRRIYNQALIQDPAANALGFALTNGGVGVIGNQ